MKSVSLLAAAFVVLSAAHGLARADEVDVKDLLKRLEQVEKQNQALQRQIEELRLQQAKQPPTASLTPPVVQASRTIETSTQPPTAAAPGPSDQPSQPAAPADGGGTIFNPSPNPGGGGIAPGSFPYATNPAGARADYLAGFSDGDGFFLRSPDDNFLMRITGQVQADFRSYDTQRDSTDVDSFLVRRARLGVEGEVFKFWEYRLLPDFSNTQSNTSFVAAPRILDAYVNAHYWDEFQVEAGKFKQPFSYEQLVQDRFIPTVERSIIDQLVPARDVGVMVHGEKLFNDTVDYALSVFNGEINDDYDQNNGKDVAGRFVVRPLNCDAVPSWARGLQLGVAYSVGNDKETTGSTTPTTIRTPDQVPFLVFNTGVRADGVRSRLSPEIVYFNQQFGFAAQYYYGEQHFYPGASAPRDIAVSQNGFYVMSSYLLTGETRTTYSQAVVPFNNFDARHPFQSPGAWELIARVSELRYGDDVFESYKVGRTTYGPIANPALYSQGATEVDIGFNWFLNKFVRVELAYEHDWFLQPVQLGAGPIGRLNHQDSILTRLQLAF